MAASVLRAPLLSSPVAKYFSANLHSRATIASTLPGSPFSNSCIHSVRKQPAQQVRCFSDPPTEYNVKLIFSADKSEKILKMTGDQYILEETLRKNINLPYSESCRTGHCYSCLGKLNRGLVNQTEQGILGPDKVDKGFVVLCKAQPAANVEIRIPVKTRELYEP